MLTINDFARKPVDHKRELQRHMASMPDTKPLRQINDHLFAPVSK